MRLRFPIGLHPDEVLEREQLFSRIDGWWRAFSAKTGHLDSLFRGRTDWDLPKFMEENLQTIHPHLMWEFGPGRRGGHRLVITPEFRHRLRPLVDAILRRAPVLDGWELYPYRLAEPLADTFAAAAEQTEVDLAAVSFVATVGPSHLVDLCFFTDSEEFGPGEAVLLSEALLGEELLGTWVGVVDVRGTAAEGASAAEPIARLLPSVTERVDLIRRTLPGHPLFQDPSRSDYTLLELSPDEEDEYPAQEDLLTARTRYLEMWKTAHLGRRFCSSRFSRHGEVFAYVKWDTAVRSVGSRVWDRDELEDTLDGALTPLGLGCSLGGGTGRVHSYVDLAFADVDQGIELVRDVLRAGGIGRRAWIQLFDDEWQDEWVGVYDDAPPPPLPGRDDD